MNITFRDLYVTIQNSKLLIARMEVDLENTSSPEAKGLITEEINRLRQSYMSLFNTSVQTTEYMTEIRQKLDQCISYIDVY